MENLHFALLTFLESPAAVVITRLTSEMVGKVQKINSCLNQQAHPFLINWLKEKGFPYINLPTSFFKNQSTNQY